MMQTEVDDTAEYKMAVARLRDREYAHLHELINTTPVDQILEPLSAIKTGESVEPAPETQVAGVLQRQLSQSNNEKVPLKSAKIRQLDDIMHSIDSLRCSDAFDHRTRRQIDREKNRAKLGILLF